MVGLQHATESFTALDLTSDGTNILIRINEMVAQALMISLAMIVLDVFTNSQGQKTEPTAKLFDNQVLEIEIVRDFGRASARDSDH